MSLAGNHELANVAAEYQSTLLIAQACKGP